MGCGIAPSLPLVAHAGRCGGIDVRGGTRPLNLRKRRCDGALRRDQMTRSSEVLAARNRSSAPVGGVGRDALDIAAARQSVSEAGVCSRIGVPNHVPNSAETTPQNPIKPDPTPSKHRQSPCK